MERHLVKQVKQPPTIVLRYHVLLPSVLKDYSRIMSRMCCPTSLKTLIKEPPGEGGGEVIYNGRIM